MIDAHLHVWSLARRQHYAHAYPWLTTALGTLHADHLPEQAWSVLQQATRGHRRIDRAVLVQAEDSCAETDYLLDCAAQPWVAGVVGWVPLHSPQLTADELTRRHGSALVGVRHLVHDDARADFLDRRQVRQSLALVAEAGLAFDVPDAWPRHLDQAIAVARDLPTLTVVIDHLAKPPRHSPDELFAWRAALARAAALPNVVAKVSGLHHLTAPLTTGELRPILDEALALFGADRLMYGGDWPMTTLFAGGYQPHVEAIAGWVDHLTVEQQAAIWQHTAERVYRLNVSIG